MCRAGHKRNYSAGRCRPAELPAGPAVAACLGCVAFGRRLRRTPHGLCGGALLRRILAQDDRLEYGEDQLTRLGDGSCVADRSRAAPECPRVAGALQRHIRLFTLGDVSPRLERLAQKKSDNTDALRLCCPSPFLQTRFEGRPGEARKRVCAALTTRATGGGSAWIRRRCGQLFGVTQAAALFSAGSSRTMIVLSTGKISSPGMPTRAA
jgi:hypothetical protein